jgi:hypothetical protein
MVAKTQTAKAQTAKLRITIDQLIPPVPPTTELTYPISPDYIKSWSAERAIAEIIANAIDADPVGFTIGYADGILDITDNADLGIGAEGMILGYSDKRERDDQIGQFGEGLKIATLVLARDPSVGGVFIETVGYAVVPAIVEQGDIVGLNIPVKSGVKPKVLRWRLWPCERQSGTRVRIAVAEKVAAAAQSRFLQLVRPQEVTSAKVEDQSLAPSKSAVAGQPGSAGSPAMTTATTPASPKNPVNQKTDAPGGTSKTSGVTYRGIDPSYLPPEGSGRIITAGKPGLIYIGGVLVSERKDFVFSYDLALTSSRALQNRDRTTIDGVRLNGVIEEVLCECTDRAILQKLVQAALDGAISSAEAHLFSNYGLGVVQKRLLRDEIGKDLFGDRAVFYMGRGERAAEDSLDLVDHGYTEIAMPKMESWIAERLMEYLGIPSSTSLAKHKTPPKQQTTEWVAEKDLTPDEKRVLTQTVAMVRSLWGAEALDKVRVYSKTTLSSGECVDMLGFYEPGSGSIALLRDRLSSYELASQTMIHEVAHRLAHRFPHKVGLAWPEYNDRTRGFERALGHMVAMIADRYRQAVGEATIAREAAATVAVKEEAKRVPQAAWVAADLAAAARGQKALPGFHFIPRGGWFDRVVEPGMAFGELFLDVATKLQNDGQTSGQTGGKNGQTRKPKKFSAAAYSKANFVRSRSVLNISKGMIPYDKSYPDITDVLAPTGLSPAVAWLAGYVPGVALGRRYDWKQQARAARFAPFTPYLRKFAADRCGEVAAFAQDFGPEWQTVTDQILAIVNGGHIGNATSSAEWLKPFARLVELERERCRQINSH